MDDRKRALFFPGVISSALITMEDLTKANVSIAAIYKYKNTIHDPEIKKYLELVLKVASDGLCNLCHELGIDPNCLDYFDTDHN